MPGRENVYILNARAYEATHQVAGIIRIGGTCLFFNLDNYNILKIKRNKKTEKKNKKKTNTKK